MENGAEWCLLGRFCIHGSIYPSNPAASLLHKVWTIKVDGKIQFFSWLLLQNRLWTADRLAARGWPHNAVCSLCDQSPESAAHLMLGCSFTKEIWHLLFSQWPKMARAAGESSSLRSWWRKVTSGLRSVTKSKEMALAAYVVRHIWNERNLRVFQQKERTAVALCSFIRDSFSLLLEAKEL